MKHMNAEQAQALNGLMKNFDVCTRSMASLEIGDLLVRNGTMRRVVARRTDQGSGPTPTEHFVAFDDGTIDRYTDGKYSVTVFVPLKR